MRGDYSADKSFQFALDVVSKGEALGFDITLIAERLLGPDLEAWMLTAALAARTKTIQIMPAIYPGMITPQLAAKMGATLDRITGGRFVINVVNGWYQKEFELFSNGGWIASSEARYKRMERIRPGAERSLDRGSFHLQRRIFPRRRRDPAAEAGAPAASTDLHRKPHQIPART